MNISDRLNSMIDHLSDAYDKIDEMGGELPNHCNLENLATAISTISGGGGGGGGGWNPSNPTLEGLKDAINKGANVPIGVEIPDTYAGADNPLIVVQKLDSTNNSNYNGAEGFILQRKYCTNQVNVCDTFDADGYVGSSPYKYLASSYANNCSDAIMDIISDISVRVQYSTPQAVTAKWFIPSVEEVYGDPSAHGTYNKWGAEGKVFQYYLDNGGGVATNNASSSRVAMLSTNTSTAVPWWLRTAFPYGVAVLYRVTANGTVEYAKGMNELAYLRPCCFISKN